MAEGFAKNMLPQNINIKSAGTKAHGLNPYTVDTMKEIGIDISHQQSNSISDNELSQHDLIITLCGDARDKCPILSDNNNIHWDLEDPANAEGNEEEIMSTYRKVRDQISNNIKSML